MVARYGDRRQVSSRVSEWLNGPKSRKVVKVDVYDGTYPSMTLSGGAYLTGDRLANVATTTGDYASTPDSAALDITGDIEIVVRLKLNTWGTVANNRSIISKRASGQDAYQLYISGGGGALEWRWFEPTAKSASATTGFPFSSGEVGWIKVTFDVDNGSGQSETKFYTAADQATEPTSWTQLGTTRVTAGVATIASTTAPLWIGVDNFGALAAGDYYRVIIRNGIGGTVAFDANFASPAYGARSFVESSANAATVSIASTASWVAPWTLPAGATFVRVCCVGGGGGGGSGRMTGTGTNATGGSGGGSGGVSFAEFSASAFTSPVTVTVGTGGTGATGRTTVSNGTGGSAGGATTFGSFCGAGGAPVGLAAGTSGSNISSGGAGLYTSASGTANVGAGTRPTPTILVSGGVPGGGISSNVAATTSPLAIAGLVVGSDVLAVRTFICGQGTLASTTQNTANGTNGQNGCGGGGSGASLDPYATGAGGNGGNGLCVVVSYRDVDVQEFTASGTWNKPVGDYTLAKIFVVGGGGGGASGHNVDYATTIAGVSGGGGGAITCITIPFSQLGNTETVTVGLGGTGGASVTATATNGNLGNPGGQSSFGTWATALGGSGGILTAGTAPAIATGFSFNGGSGAGGLTTGANAGAGANSYTGGGGGGAGGTASNPTIRLGGAGGVGAAYTSAVTAATSGGNGPSVATVAGFYGGNGGGGSNAASQTGNASPGGNGAPKGGGGGGGGICRTGFASGAGGNGGDGYVCVVCV